MGEEAKEEIKRKGERREGGKKGRKSNKNSGITDDKQEKERKQKVEDEDKRLRNTVEGVGKGVVAWCNTRRVE